jgi:spore cortex biosynthesis protein YabQ
MILSFSGQARLFLMTVGVGIAIGLVYDLFRIIRKIYRHPNFLTQLEDFVYWISATFVMFYFLLNCNNGELRFSSILGAALGAVLYFAAASPLVVKVSVAVANFIGDVLRLALIIVLAPVKFLISVLAEPVNMSKRGIKKLLSPLKAVLQKAARYARIKAGKFLADIKIMAKKI